jgi:hypothetical protein
MLILLTLGIMLAVAWVYAREGLFTAFVMLVNVFFAGLLTFNFFEPLADGIVGLLGFVRGYEEMLAMTVLFCAFLGLLRLVTNSLSDTVIEFPAKVQQIGGAVCGLLTGYLLSGFLICAFQTLPLPQHFLGYEPRHEGESALRRIMPPDRVWLAMMHRAGTHAFARGQEELPASDALADRYPTFDRYGTFEMNYYRFRRVPEK